jgi:hypothetical protein
VGVPAHRIFCCRKWFCLPNRIGGRLRPPYIDHFRFSRLFFRFDACQRDRRKPCIQNLAWLLWTTRRGALAMHTTMHAGGPSDIPVSPEHIHRRTHAGLGTGVRKSLALSRRRLAGNGPVDRPQSLSSSHIRSRGGWGSSVHITNIFCGVKEKIGIFLSLGKSPRRSRGFVRVEQIDGNA